MGIRTQILVTKLVDVQVVHTPLLPTEIIIAILLHLPARSLARFKIVCKSWHDLINGQDFAILHREHSLATGSNLHFLFASPKLIWGDFDTFANPIELSYPLNNPFDYGQILIGCVDGLVCLSTYYHHLSYNLYFINPTTRTHRVLTDLPAFPEELSWSNIVDNIPSLIYGFGCDRISGDYKFVRVLQCMRPETGYIYNEVMVYSVKHNMWEKVIANIPYIISCIKNCGVFLNEALHWINYGENREQDMPLNSLIGFDLTKNMFFEVGLPQFGLEWSIISVCVLDGCLCVTLSSLYTCEIWMMEYGVVSSWTMLCWLKKESEVYAFEEPIGYTKDRKQLLVRLASRTVTRIDLETMKIEPPDNPTRLWDAHVCVENLYMLDESIYALDDKKQHGKKKTSRVKKTKGRKRMAFLWVCC